jgi:hypothetical protein
MLISTIKTAIYKNTKIQPFVKKYRVGKLPYIHTCTLAMMQILGRYRF